MLALTQRLFDNFDISESLAPFYPSTTDILLERGSAEIFQTLDELSRRLGNFANDFVIIGGANLVLREMRQTTTDVDILVSGGTFSAMKSMRGARIKQPPERARDYGANNDSVWSNTTWTQVPVSGTTHMGDGHFPISYEMYATRELETVGGHRLAPLRDVWESKAAPMRPIVEPDCP